MVEYLLSTYYSAALISNSCFCFWDCWKWYNLSILAERKKMVMYNYALGVDDVKTGCKICSCNLWKSKHPSAQKHYIRQYIPWLFFSYHFVGDFCVLNWKKPKTLAMRRWAALYLEECSRMIHFFCIWRLGNESLCFYTERPHLYFQKVKIPVLDLAK